MTTTKTVESTVQPSKAQVSHPRKKNGEYKYNSYTDQHLVRFLGFDPEALMVRRAGPRRLRELWRQTLIRRENGETPLQTQLAASPL
jgi:hypothetical protein